MSAMVPRSAARVARAIARTLLLAALPLVPTAAHAAEQASTTVTEVRLERVKPAKEKYPTLRFLKENRDFIRERFDRLRERTVEHREATGPIDPRFLEYQRMLAAIHAGQDSASASEDARKRWQLYDSVTELGDLERQLDQLERLLAEQRGRLGILQADFEGDQRTALMVVLTGDPGARAPGELALALDDRAPVTLALSSEQLESLRRGGAVEVFHGFVEPREQVVEVALAGGAWPAADPAYLTLEPARDRLTLLRLDLRGLDPGQGAASLQAALWLHDTRIP
jgi:hypothetical protein